MQTVVVVGAGSFGAWTAHQLARAGLTTSTLETLERAAISHERLSRSDLESRS